MAAVDILIPTYMRPDALAATLTSLCFQDQPEFRVVISDQGDGERRQTAAVQTAIRILALHGHEVEVRQNLPRRGMAHQRQFLLDASTAPYVLFLDDDLILEPYVLSGMLRTIQEEGCGFVGRAVIGLSFKDDIRPQEQAVEVWEGKVLPEKVAANSPQWERYRLHNAANLLHVERRLNARPERPIRYKIAWVGGCVLYDAEKLRESGGFSFWKELPEQHAGEDVMAQLQVMRRYGGCGIMPSGVYHQELRTTITERQVNAPQFLAPGG